MEESSGGRGLHRKPERGSVRQRKLWIERETMSKILKDRSDGAFRMA